MTVGPTGAEPGQVRASIFYLDDPAVGTADITYSVQANKESTIGAIVFNGTDSVEASAFNNTSGDDPFTIDITTLTGNAVVFTHIGMEEETYTAQTPLSEKWALTNSHSGEAATATVASAGANTFAWDNTAMKKGGMAAIALKPAPTVFTLNLFH